MILIEIRKQEFKFIFWFSSESETVGREFVDDGAFKDIPESDGFIGSTRKNVLSAGALSEVEDSLGVSSECCDFLHIRLIPNDDLIERVSVRRDDLLAVLREDEIADLRAGVDAIDLFELLRVVDSNAAISSATSECENVVLVRRESDCFDSSTTLRDLCKTTAHF